MAADPWWLAELDELRDLALEGVDPRLRLLTRPQVTQLLVLPRDALLSSAVRQRLGLPAVRVGRRMRFRMLDVARLVAKGMEFPTATPTETEPTDVLTTIPSNARTLEGRPPREPRRCAPEATRMTRRDPNDPA